MKGFRFPCRWWIRSFLRLSIIVTVRTSGCNLCKGIDASDADADSHPANFAMASANSCQPLSYGMAWPASFVKKMVFLSDPASS